MKATAISRKHALACVSALLTSLLLPAPSFADTAYEIYSYGSGDFLAAVFNGIAMITGGGAMHSLVKMCLILMVLYALMTTISGFIGSGGQQKGGGGDIYRGEGPVTIISMAITAAVVIGLFLTPKSNVAIIDRIDPQQSQVVSNVPFPSAFIAHMMSSIGDTIGKEFEQVFSLPDSMQFRNGGVALGAKYTDALMNIYPPNSSTENMPAAASLISKTISEYCIRCVFPNYSNLDGVNGSKTAALDELTTTDDLMAHLQRPLYRSPNVTIIAPNEDGYASCADAIVLADNLWNTHMSAWKKDLETKLSGNSGISGIVAVGNPINLGSGALTNEVLSRYFPNSSTDYDELLKTLALINLIRESYTAYHEYMSGSSSAADDISRKATTSGWLTAAKFFNSLVHTTRAIAEGLIYGMSVLLPLFIIFGGLSALLFYGKLALWLQMWVPIYILVNLYADIEVQRVIGNILLTDSYKGPSFKSVDQIARQLEMTLGYVGMLSPTVPGLAWGLVSGGAYAATQAVRTFGGQQTVATAQSTGTQVMGMGNISMGNHGINNDTIAGSSILSSQMGHQASVVKGEETVKMLTQQMNRFGGANTYTDLAGTAGAIMDTQRLGGASGGMMAAGGDWQKLLNAAMAGGADQVGANIGKLAATGGSLTDVAAASGANAAFVTGAGGGKLEAAGGSAENVGKAGFTEGGAQVSSLKGKSDGAGGDANLRAAAYAESYGAMHGTIEAAKKRAELTGRGDWRAAMADHKMVQAFTEYTKSLGFEGYLREVGMGNASQAMTLGELQTHFDRIGTLAMGKLAGHDMGTKEGREGFYTQLRTAQGVDVAVTDKNVHALNKQIEAQGGKTRLKVGDVARIQGTEDKITSIGAKTGVDRVVTDHKQTTLGNKTDINNGAVNITSGTLKTNRHNTEIHTNGKFTTNYGDYTRNLSGTETRDFQINQKLRPEGTYNYDAKGNLVSSDTNYTQTERTTDPVHGAVTKIKDQQGNVVRTEGRAGSHLHEDVNKVSKDGGVDYRGMGSAGTRETVEWAAQHVFRQNEEQAKNWGQDVAGVGGYAVDSISKLAGQWLTVRPALMPKGAAASGGAGVAAGGGITQEKLDAANRYQERLAAD